jgi:hypothetical protein
MPFNIKPRHLVVALIVGLIALWIANRYDK